MSDGGSSSNTQGGNYLFAMTSIFYLWASETAPDLDYSSQIRCIWIILQHISRILDGESGTTLTELPVDFNTNYLWVAVMPMGRLRG